MPIGGTRTEGRGIAMPGRASPGTTIIGGTRESVGGPGIPIGGTRIAGSGTAMPGNVNPGTRGIGGTGGGVGSPGIETGTTSVGMPGKEKSHLLIGALRSSVTESY